MFHNHMVVALSDSENFCDNYKKSLVGVTTARAGLSLVIAGENKTTTMHISFSTCFAIFAFALHMYVVARPLPAKPDWTHMLDVSPHHIALAYERPRIMNNIDLRRIRKEGYRRETATAMAKMQDCIANAHRAGLQTTEGLGLSHLALSHAENATKWRKRATLEERGETHFIQALGLHDRRGGADIGGA